MSEKQEVCTICHSEGSLVRVPQMPFVVSKEEKEAKVGSATKEYIEQNKDLLRQMKQEARSTTYDG